jgi:hypothetical protein
VKLDWLSEPEKLIECVISHRGHERRLLLHHLSGADLDAADRKFPSLKPPPLTDDAGKPMRDKEGRPMYDFGTDEYRNASEERAANRMTYLAVLAMGAEAFDARDIDGQMAELRNPANGFTRVAIYTIGAAAFAAAMATPKALEEAKDKTRPIAFGDSPEISDARP